MKKIILITSGVLFVGALFLLVYAFISRTSSSTPTIPSSSGTIGGGLPPVATSQGLPQKINQEKETGSEYLVLQGVGGSAKVRNFYKQTVYTEEGGVIFEQNDSYMLLYRSEEGFRVVIYDEKNPAEAQRNSESTLLSILGADTDGVCRIGVSVWYPYEKTPRTAQFCK